MESDLRTRLEALPRLGVGISGEYGVRPSIDPSALAEAHPGLVHFVEFGSDTERGLDPAILRWVEAGGRATWHFLDVNFEEPQDLDPAWIEETVAFATRIRSPWLCGDAGLWHFGPRDRGHGLLLPPVLTDESAAVVARSIAHLRAASGLEVLPENPPSTYWLGDLHVLDYFAAVSEKAQSGLLLDLAHLAIFQRAVGEAPTTGLDGFPLERVVELHVAGGGEAVSADGLPHLVDDHRAAIHPDVWRILEALEGRTPNLKAVCYECEHNRPEEVVETFVRLNEWFPGRGDRL